MGNINKHGYGEGHCDTGMKLPLATPASHYQNAGCSPGCSASYSSSLLICLERQALVPWHLCGKLRWSSWSLTSGALSLTGIRDMNQKKGRFINLSHYASPSFISPSHSLSLPYSPFLFSSFPLPFSPCHSAFQINVKIITEVLSSSSIISNKLFVSSNHSAGRLQAWHLSAAGAPIS